MTTIVLGEGTEARGAALGIAERISERGPDPNARDLALIVHDL